MPRLMYARAPRVALAVLLALATVLAVGAYAAKAPHGRAAAAVAADFGPGTVPGALVAIDSDSPRGQYIDANGVAHCLPTGPNAVHGQDGDYPHMWFSFRDADCNFQADSAPVKAPAPAANPAGDVDPVLTLVSTGANSATVKWTADNPPADDTVVGYEVRYAQTSVAYGASDPVGKVLTYTIPSLSPNTQYKVQVRARYNTTGSFGGWSNQIIVTTSAVLS